MLAEEEEQVIHRVRTLLNLRIATAKDPSGSGRKVPDLGDRGKRSLDSAAIFARWKKIFMVYDKDNSGTITFKELRSLMRNSLHLSEAVCPDADLKVIFDKLDEDGSGAIEFNEFCTFVQTQNKASSQDTPPSLGRAMRLALARERVRSDSDLRDLFEKSDLNCDNEISAYELSRFFRDVLRLTQHEVSEFHIKKLHKVLDTDCSGSVEVGEFIRWITDHVEMPDGSRPKHHVSRSLLTGKSTGFGTSLGSTSPRTGKGTSLPSLAPPSTAPSPKKGGGAGRKHCSPSKRPTSTPARRGPPLMALGGRRTEYLSIPGAERLNRVEQRLFAAGFDVRGEFFKVSDPEAMALARAGSSLMGKTASSGALGMRKSDTSKHLLDGGAVTL